MSARALLLLLALLSPLAARAGDAAGEPSLRYTAYTRTGGQLYLSSAQTTGGLGGGFGLRATANQLFLVQADASYLSMLGNTLALRLAVGVQRPGVWTPALLGVRSMLLGHGLRFATGDREGLVEGPATSWGLVLAPLRFTTDTVQVSVAELGFGLGWDWPGLATAFDVTLLEVGLRF